jgi:class 3 adenylate cyclase/pimeloyl-ACP methyl ester carboxylesterase
MERRLTAILAADVAGYSRLMSEDEPGTLTALQAHHSELIAPAVAKHRGRIVKLMGDGILVEFGSVVEAVGCAAEIQHEMAKRNFALPDDRKMLFRIGVHLGDVIVEGDDIYGDGVNIASRLEGLAEPGGVCISRQAYDQVEGKLSLTFQSLGPQKLKNIARPVEVYSLGGSRKELQGDANPKQDVKYCRAADGVRLAYATVGNGPLLVKAANWMNHLEYDWESPIFRHIWRGLAREHTLIRYDARGNGLSDWEVDEISFEAWVGDLEAVVEAIGAKRFPLLGISQGCAISIAYAVRHPERVSHLILYGGFALGGNKRSQVDQETRQAIITLTRLGWGLDHPTFRQIFASRFIPEGTKEQYTWFDELQRKTTSPECAARYLATSGDIDVKELLPKVRIPTLVMHVRGDLVAPIDLGREIAAGIPGARFIALPGKNHIFFEYEPACGRFFEEIRLFLSK